MMSGLTIRHKGQTYSLYTPQGEPVGVVFMGNDGDTRRDIETLNAITRAMAKRWDISSSK